LCPGMEITVIIRNELPEENAARVRGFARNEANCTGVEVWAAAGYGHAGGELRRCVAIVETAQDEKNSIHLPGSLLSDMDAVARRERRSRGEIVRRAVAEWLRERNGRLSVESLKRGYLEMAGINLTIASEAFQAEDDADHTLGRTVASE
jgi:Predicted transcriptional regulators containing the CopG/Arc/MetJ DNA-binding domain and a metal-binding domain